jgi:hypothetical protein
VEPKPTLRNLGYAGGVGTSIAAAARTVARHRALGRGVKFDHMLVMAYVEAVARLLEREYLVDANTIAFDQGPLYFVSRPSLLDERLAPWRETVFDTWAPLLDVVVWLDAPDEILTERINARRAWHRLKGAKRETAAEALAVTRKVYENAISSVTERRRGLAIVRFDTERWPAGEIAEAVLAAVAATAAERNAGRLAGDA